MVSISNDAGLCFFPLSTFLLLLPLLAMMVHGDVGRGKTQIFLSLWGFHSVPKDLAVCSVARANACGHHGNRREALLSSVFFVFFFFLTEQLNKQHFCFPFCCRIDLKMNKKPRPVSLSCGYGIHQYHFKSVQVGS